MKPAYETTNGEMFMGNAEEVLASDLGSRIQGRVDLVFTSPPFPLNRKKKYGNLTGERYVSWLAGFAPVLRDTLSPTGSIVLEVGNSWESGHPVMSTLGLRALLSFLDSGKLHLCQQFVCHNPARLPGPAQWVNVERVRVKDSFTHVWWMSPTEHPRADNRRVLTRYSAAMRQLLDSGKYNSGTRPSEHHVGKKSFLCDHGGAIPSNVLSFANTRSTDAYRRYCRKQGLRAHPARMQPEMAEFFIKFLTDPGDLVLDPFAGSNTTGAVAERLGRHWVAIEAEAEYVTGSYGRFVTADRESSEESKGEGNAGTVDTGTTAASRKPEEPS